MAAAVILDRVKAALTSLADGKTITHAEPVNEEEEQRIRRDYRALTLKVRAYERRFGGYYGTGF